MKNWLPSFWSPSAFLTFNLSSTTKVLSFFADGRWSIIIKQWIFSTLTFETIDIGILADEAKEQEEVTTAAAVEVARRDDATDAGQTN